MNRMSDDEFNRLIEGHRLPTPREVDEMVRRAHEDHARAIEEAFLQAVSSVGNGVGKVLRALRVGGWSRA